MASRIKRNKRVIGETLAELDATSIIYGLRAVDSAEYFYVGRTRFDKDKRLAVHLAYARAGKTSNKHLERKLLKVGLDRVVSDVIETVPRELESEREYFWINTLPNLCNLKLAELPGSYREYSDKVRDPDYFARMLTALERGKRKCPNPKDQQLADRFFDVAVLALKRLASQFGLSFSTDLNQGFTARIEAL